ncbi:MAG: hypothetical protein ACPL1Y_06195, partial [Thermoplasmata archaeon]
QEVYGYTVKVITGWDNTGTPISEERTMYGDPLSAYKQPSGAWTDIATYKGFNLQNHLFLN